MCELKFYFPSLKKSLMIDSKKCKMYKSRNGRYYAISKIKKDGKEMKSSRFIKKEDYDKMLNDGCGCGKMAKKGEVEMEVKVEKNE